MKNLIKSTFAVLALLLATTVNAQELTSKKGFPILPEAKDWSISFNAVPLVDWAFDKTRVLSGTPATTAGGALDYSVANTVVGKLMKDANTAYRGKVQFNFGSTSEDTYAGGVKTTEKTSETDITLGGGLQYYRGKGRLRGYYGYEGLIGLSTGPNTKFSYSEALTAGSRDTEVKSGMGLNLGVRGFVGAEYFFAPKMSVGAEFGWGLGYGMKGDTEVTTETFGAATETKKTVGASSGFGAGVDNAGGSINLAIYF